MENEYKTFAEFYPFYLEQHSNRNCRRLHFVGSFLVLVIFFFTIYSNNWWYLLLAPLAGYGFAWVGHFVFEKNKPATFSYPIYSFIGDWAMFKDMLLGRI